MIKKLRERVAHRCSKPDCRVLTIGPGDDPDSSASIGKAAHIAAAAPGGPRFDASMTRELRRSFNNGIWLCSNHAAEIDADRTAFPPELLKAWKAEAERRAREERGRRLPEPDDARAEVLSVLTGATPKFTRTAISNAHAATKDRLDQLDARLWVETSYMGGVSQIGIHARENVDLQFQVPVDLRDQWKSSMTQLLDHGGEVRLPTAGVKLTGSPLFEILLDSTSLADAQLIIGPSTVKKAVARLRLTEPGTDAIDHFEDVHGCIDSGRKSGTFEGKACGGAMSTALRMELGDGPAPWKSTFNLALHFDGWEGLDFQALPYLDKLLSLFERMRAGWLLEFELEIDGKSVGRGRGGAMGDLNALDSMARVLDYVAAIRAIAAHLGSSVQFRCVTTYSDRDVAEACEVRDRIKGRRVFGPEVCPVKFTLTASGDNIQRILAPAIAALRVDSDPHELKAFGQSLILPRNRIDIINFQARVAAENVDVSALKDGDGVPIELLPAKGFRYMERYLRPDEPTGPT